MNDLQEVLLEMYVDIKELCNKNNIQLFLVCGNAIGAMRHKGFIPWDDDLDVAIFKDDLNTLKAAAMNDKEFARKYFYQDYKTESEYNIPFAKIRKYNTLLIEKGAENPKINQGIFIDIFTIDNISKKRVIQKIQFYSCQLYECLIRGNRPNNVLKRCIINTIKLIGLKNQFLKFFDLISNHLNISTGLYYSYYSSVENLLTKDCILPERIVPFENIEAVVFNNVEQYLTDYYGDYNIIPSIEEQEAAKHASYYEIKC